jgi:hypothetical protein
MEPDVYFYGRVISKIGPKTYSVTDGAFTTCVQPTPRWEMTGSRGTITLDKHAVMKNMVLKVKDVPLMYLPWMYYPINKDDRSTGFLLPTYGTSTITGQSLNNAFFLVLGRSQDATFYHTLSAKTGQTYAADYRYIVSPGSEGRANFDLINERNQYADDGVTILRPAHRSYHVRGDANQALPHGFRLIGSTDYFTDITTQQLYEQNIQDLSQRNRFINASLTGAFNRYSILATYYKNDTFYGDTTATRLGNAPAVRLSVGNKPIGRSKVYFGGGGEMAYLVRQNDINDPLTNQSLWRFDGSPSVRAPIGSLPYLSPSVSASWRLTHWMETLDPLTGQQVPVGLTRSLLQLSAGVTGPSFSRVFQTPKNGYAERFKHLIEPNINWRWYSPFADFNRVVQHDGTDTIVGGTSQLDYGIRNTLMARRRAPEGSPPGTPGIVRSLLTVNISQTYYSNEAASKYDPYYVSGQSKTSSFSNVQLAAVASPADSVQSAFRMEVDAKYKVITSYGATGSVNGARARVDVSWTRQRLVSELTGTADDVLALPQPVTTIRTRDNRLSGTYMMTFNMLEKDFLQQRIIAAYNTQCCGVAFDYSVNSTTYSTVPMNRTLGISFTLAGIGTFTNPFGSFGGAR